MSFSKWLSVGVGVITALLVAAILCTGSGPRLPVGDDSTVTALVASAFVGALLGLAHWLIISRFEGELWRLHGHLDRLGKAESRDAAGKFRMGLAPIAAAADHAAQGMRDRIDQLASKRRELEIQLRIAEAERRHAETILNSITDAVLVTDGFNELTLANDAAARTLGFETSYSRRRPIDQVVQDPALVKLIKDMRETAASMPTHRKSLEHRFKTAEGESIFNVTVTGIGDGPMEGDRRGPLATAAGQDVAGVVTVLRDITREKEISELKSDFVSSVSHELRTPLSSIKAYVEMLVDGEAHDEETRAEFYNIIQAETARLSRLIDNILNIGRIESGVIRAQREQLSLPALVHEAIEVMRPQARAKNIELRESSLPVFFLVLADKDMICQATLNLIGNAIKYTPAGGRVTVGVCVDEADRLVHVSVTDTGVGIPADAIPHLFTKFFRVDRHRKLAPGTGLGLNLVKQIIETVHGGKVSVSSELGAGSTFTYSLPLADNT